MHGTLAYDLSLQLYVRTIWHYFNYCDCFGTLNGIGTLSVIGGCMQFTCVLEINR